MMNVLRSSVFAAVALFFSSCATMFTGTRDNISFNTTPKGAKVVIDGSERCVTPCQYKVGRSLSAKHVSFELKNYESKTLELDRSFNGVSVLNIFVGLLPWVVDVATGSMMRYSTKTYNVSLEPKSSK